MIVKYYCLRYQPTVGPEEFLIRDAKQFTGLADCQGRSVNKIDYHATGGPVPSQRVTDGSQRGQGRAGR